MNIAEETLCILEAGHYVNPSNEIVSIGDDLTKSRDQSILYKPGDFDPLINVISKQFETHLTDLNVTNKSTLCAARELNQAGQFKSIACLNFASAKNPGGGFKSGAQAQEESLARCSGLYATLIANGRYYEMNRNCHTPFYTDHIIFSPFVPVFREDGQNSLLDHHYLLSFITAPAVNKGAIRQLTPEANIQIHEVMADRAKKVLAIAAFHRCEALILGAWGCGVFRNDPQDVANIWRGLLTEDTLFKNRFKRVVFAVLDGQVGEPTCTIFRNAFR